MTNRGSIRFVWVCDILRTRRASLRNVREGVVTARGVLLIASVGATGQEGEALRQLEWCKNASRMVSDAHGVSASTTSTGVYSYRAGCV